MDYLQNFFQLHENQQIFLNLQNEAHNHPSLNYQNLAHQSGKKYLLPECDLHIDLMAMFPLRLVRVIDPAFLLTLDLMKASRSPFTFL